MASLRARQHNAGLTTVTLVVPRADAAGFVTLARSRRERWSRSGRPGQSPRWLTLPRVNPARAARSAIHPGDILRLRELLEVAAVGLVIERMNAVVAKRLRSQLEREERLDGEASGRELQRLHAMLGDLSGDEVLRFLLHVALRLTEDHSAFSVRRKAERDAGVARITRVHARIVEAILRRDRQRAEAHVRRYISGLREWLD